MDLQDTSQVLVDSLCRFYFERSVFEKREETVLNADDFCRLMQEAQEKLDAEIYEAQSGGGKVPVKVTGKHEVTELHIDPEVVDPDDVEMLEDLVRAAVNEAVRAADTARENALGRMAPGLKGMF